MIALGDVRVHVLDAGRIALDGGAVFGVVPRVLWEKLLPPDEQNRVTLGLNVALIESAQKRILVDTGVGDKWGEKERAIFRLERGDRLLAALAALSLRPEDIDVVINSHLHFDHAGGNTRLQDGKPVPTFPRARYVIQLGEWEDATNPHERSRASYREENYLPLADARQLETIQGEATLAPGVRVLPVGGHTAYHQMVIVSGGGEQLLIPTDLVPTTCHLPLPYVMAYDLFPIGTLAAKRRLLQDAVEDGSRLLFYHDPRTALGKLKLQKAAYVVSEERA